MAKLLARAGKDGRPGASGGGTPVLRSGLVAKPDGRCAPFRPTSPVFKKSQCSQETKDHLRAQNDDMINLKAELEIGKSRDKH
jgi:hypothetical protein